MSIYRCTKCSVEVQGDELPIHLCDNCGNWKYNLITPRFVDRQKQIKRVMGAKLKNDLMRQRLQEALTNGIQVFSE